MIEFYYRSLLRSLYSPLFVLFVIASAVGPAQADGAVILPVQAVMDMPETAAKIDGSVAFYFGATPYPAVGDNLGEYVTNKKTNAFGKTDADSCNWVMLSALITLQEKAKSLGGDAVVNIHSYYKKNDVSYNDQFECHRGFLMSGVTLKGDVVKLAE